MMLARRLIVCLDVRDGRVVKGVSFEGLRDVGDPVALAQRYEAEGADEICFLDISASLDGRGTLLDTVRRTAERLFVPLTVGGGVRTANDMAEVLRAGADKVSVNSSAVQRPELVTECAERFGSQCVVASIDARQEGNRWRVVTHGGKRPTERDALEWAEECARRGAGEILLTSIAQDGARSGYDLALTRAVASRVRIPVIASGGAGNADHVVAAFAEAGASAALVAGILHDGVTSVAALKDAMAQAGVRTREAA
ncbi:MAG: imidazole glycerol phosphate synthase subunit HisF [Myxococcaceae bacterium]